MQIQMYYPFIYIKKKKKKKKKLAHYQYDAYRFIQKQSPIEGNLPA